MLFTILLNSILMTRHSPFKPFKRKPTINTITNKFTYAYEKSISKAKIQLIFYLDQSIQELETDSYQKIKDKFLESIDININECKKNIKTMFVWNETVSDVSGERLLYQNISKTKKIILKTFNRKLILGLFCHTYQNVLNKTIKEIVFRKIELYFLRFSISMIKLMKEKW